MNFLQRYLTTLSMASVCFGQSAAPVPPVAPIPPATPVPADVYRYSLSEMDRAKAEVDRVKSGMDAVRAQVEKKFNLDFDFDVEHTIEAAMEKAKFAMADAAIALKSGPILFAQAGPRPDARPMKAMTIGRRDGEDRVYRRGQDYLDRREWEKAAEEFDQFIEQKGTKADGAYYWKAYALSKLGRRDQALAALAELRKSYPSSRWLNDAKALEAEVQQAGGQALSPESQSDEDLKLFAINSLMSSDPERALPLLEKILQKNSSPKLKERALFVLAQNRSAKSNEIVVQFARGGGNPDMQQKAVEYLGIYGGKENLQVLGDIYASSTDPGLKRGILRSFMVARDKDRLLAAAKTEANPDVRREAILYLGSMNAYTELGQLYSGESTVEGKESIINSLANGGNSDRLIEIARTEKEPRLRSAAVHRLGNMSRTKTAETLVSLYGPETDRGVKEQIVRALSNQGSGKELVDVARKETDPAMKRNIVQRLSNMKSKEGTDYLMEILSK